MRDGVLTNNIDDWYLSPAGVVQVGEPIAQARPEMKKRTSRLLHHARVSIGGSGHNSFEKAEHAPHFGDSV
jgi:hypothetical protein